jgi:urease accessory protein
MNPAAETSAEIFAANRAVGKVTFEVAAARGETRRRRVAEEGPLRVRFPGPKSSDLTAVIVNTAGGIAGGDRLDVDMTAEADARLVVTTAAAEKVYRSLGPESAIRVRLAIEPNAQLTWLPQETILFDGARLRRTIEVDIAASASLILAEALVFGRAAMAETVDHGSLFDRWRVRRGGKLVFAETVRLDGAIAERLRAPAVAAGGAAVATMLILPCDEAHVAAVRAHAGWQSEAALSAWNGFAVARFVAQDGAPLRHDLMRMLGALGTPLPRSWLN